MSQQQLQNAVADRQRLAAPDARSAVSRRSFLRTMGGLAAGSLTGCVSGFGFKKCEIAKDLPFPDLVAYLNRNIDRIDAWRSDKVTLKAHGSILLPSLNAMMAVERPRNFRLQGTVVNSNVVDLGSNDERFWFWMKNDKEPGIVTARHDCLRAAQQRLPLPFEPDWLIEALGVIPLDPDEIKFERHESDPKKCLFRRRRKGPDGASLDLVTTVDTCQGTIISHSLADRAGNFVALARMSEHLHDGKTGILLPHTIELSWPQEKLGLTIRAGAIEVNPVTLPAKQFEMPRIADCPVYDIGGETQQASDEEGRAKV